MALCFELSLVYQLSYCVVNIDYNGFTECLLLIEYDYIDYGIDVYLLLRGRHLFVNSLKLLIA